MLAASLCLPACRCLVLTQVLAKTMTCLACSDPKIGLRCHCSALTRGPISTRTLWAYTRRPWVASEASGAGSPAPGRPSGARCRHQSRRPRCRPARPPPPPAARPAASAAPPPSLPLRIVHDCPETLELVCDGMMGRTSSRASSSSSASTSTSAGDADAWSATGTEGAGKQQTCVRLGENCLACSSSTSPVSRHQACKSHIKQAQTGSGL